MLSALAFSYPPPQASTEPPMPTPESVRTTALTSTDAETLRDIATRFPDLRPEVAANPATYPELLSWLGSLGDASVNAALAARRATTPAPPPPPSPRAHATIDRTDASKHRSWRTVVPIMVICAAALVAAGIIGSQVISARGSDPGSAVAASAAPANETGDGDSDGSMPDSIANSATTPLKAGDPGVTIAAPGQHFLMSSYSGTGEFMQCNFEASSISCFEASFDTTSAPELDGTCYSETAPVEVSFDGDGYQISCIEGFSADGVPPSTNLVLSPDESMACNLGDDETLCWNQLTGQGFKLSASSIDDYTY